MTSEQQKTVACISDAGKMKKEICGRGGSVTALPKARTDNGDTVTTDRADTYLHSSVENCGCFASKFLKFGIHRVKIHLYYALVLSRPQINKWANVQNFRSSAVNVSFKYLFSAVQKLSNSPVNLWNKDRFWLVYSAKRIRRNFSVKKLSFWLRNHFVAKKMSQNGARSFLCGGTVS